MSDEGTKMAVAAMIAASLGGLGGHTVGSGSDETVVSSVSIQQCQPFIDHAARHERGECALQIIAIKAEC